MLSENIRLNKLKGTVESIEGDATKVIEEKLLETGDRVLMLLPENQTNF